MNLWKICILQAVTHGEEDDMETISLLRDLSLLIGIWVAIYGIDSWRREHKGKREIELAEDVLALFYEARDAIKYMRFPFSPQVNAPTFRKRILRVIASGKLGEMQASLLNATMNVKTCSIEYMP